LPNKRYVCQRCEDSLVFGKNQMGDWNWNLLGVW